ncbi:MAG: 3-hydroxyacyl-ACP dehydratase FabZ [Desulfarculales bacterium]|jgi:3-hydroxymyristoyl/3-hydroxydecanoyl-(acyl carrier protein) dehydratase|nr:3-hydroxyacyl-ACP dehydratase FabZ [Desulfarculales bacterium]
MRFCMIDRIITWQPGISAAGCKNVALSEDFFDDHFPQKPIMPGVLMIEGMAQLGGLLLEETFRENQTRPPVKALMSMIERAKFRQPVYPGDQLIYEVELLSINDMGGRISAGARVEGKNVAEVRLLFSFHAFQDEELQRRQQNMVDIWLQGLDIRAGQ